MTLSSGVVRGMTMIARTPSSRAARDRPWAWLPALAVITPRAFSVVERLASLV